MKPQPRREAEASRRHSRGRVPHVVKVGWRDVAGALSFTLREGEKATRRLLANGLCSSGRLLEWAGLLIAPKERRRLKDPRESGS